MSDFWPLGATWHSTATFSWWGANILHWDSPTNYSPFITMMVTEQKGYCSSTQCDVIKALGFSYWFKISVVIYFCVLTRDFNACLQVCCWWDNLLNIGNKGQHKSPMVLKTTFRIYTENFTLKMHKQHGFCKWPHRTGICRCFHVRVQNLRRTVITLMWIA